MPAVHPEFEGSKKKLRRKKYLERVANKQSLEQKKKNEVINKLKKDGALWK